MKRFNKLALKKVTLRDLDIAFLDRNAGCTVPDETCQVDCTGSSPCTGTYTHIRNGLCALLD